MLEPSSSGRPSGLLPGGGEIPASLLRSLAGLRVEG